MILLKRPMRQWANGVAARRIMHRYRLYDDRTNRYCMATYRGAPRVRAWDREVNWFRIVGHATFSRWLHDGWIIVRPPLGLPVGV